MPDATWYFEFTRIFFVESFQLAFLFVTPSLGGLPTKAKECPLPIKQTSPRQTPTWYFMVSGRADRYYTLLKGDLEVVVAKGNLIIPRRNSTTGCSFMSYPGHLLLLLLLLLLFSILNMFRLLLLPSVLLLGES